MLLFLQVMMMTVGQMRIMLM